jgi:hypothetical protein
LQELDDCLAHGRYGKIREMPLSAHKTTLGELFAAVEPELGSEAIIDLGRRFYYRDTLPLLWPNNRVDAARSQDLQ